MAERRGGLGRGLGALIPSAPPPQVLGQQPGAANGVTPSPGAPAPAAPPDADLAPVPGVTFALLPRDQVAPNPRQPRTDFDDDALAELAHSLREVGFLQPVVVRPVGPLRYELVAGERRWRAAGIAGLDEVPALIRETADEAMLRDALLENLHRVQLNALEEAAAYQQLLEDFGCTQEELATRIGRSRPQVSNTLRLLRLPAPVQRRVAAGVLSAGHARALVTVEDPAAAEALATRVVAEGLSVRAVEEIVSTGLADGRPRTRTPRPRREIPAELADIAQRLGEQLETRVRVEGSRERGRVVIDYAGPGDLRRLVELIDPRG